jgi:acetyl esterase/lipase
MFILAWTFGLSASFCNSGLSWGQETTSKKAAGRNRAVADELPQPNQKVEYKKVGNKSFHLHVFEPTSPSNEGVKRPAIVFFFGGGWNSGDPKQFYTQCRTLADMGMVAMSAEYRVASRDQSKVIDCIADAQDAVAFVRKHAIDWKIDPDRIAVGGGSAGGHLAAAVATLAYRGAADGVTTKDFRPNALVLFNPALVLAATGTALDKEVESKRSDLSKRIGDRPESASPYHHIHKELPPTIIFHGKSDTTVPIASVELFRDRATAEGVDCRLRAYDGEAHGFFNYGRPRYEEVRTAMVAFLKELKYLP